jgi:CubicO group peptidase (beta-lactamase class C family)
LPITNSTDNRGRTGWFGLDGLIVLALLAFTSTALSAQQSPSVIGDYAGTLGSLHLKLHLTLGPDGSLSATLGSQDQGAWVPCRDVHLEGRVLSFTAPTVRGSWKGTVAADGNSLSGAWEQPGNSGPLNFVREVFVPPAKPSPVDGIWLGQVQVGNQSRRVQVVVKSNSAGREFCTLDDVDDYSTGLECANIVFTGEDFSFDIPLVGGHWSGKLSADAQSLTGIWSQKAVINGEPHDQPTPLNFGRRSTLLSVQPPQLRYDPAMPPVAAADLQSVLDADLAEALKSGELAPETGAGVSIAVVAHGVSRIFSYGTAKPDSIFEIGSITKTFTGLILSQLAVQGKVRLDEPVRVLLPPGTVTKPSDPEITLLDLATQRSGLPSLPDNLDLSDVLQDPYANYHVPDLYFYVRTRGVARATGGSRPNSGGLGFALLEQALADHAGASYSSLLQEEITKPLGLKDTVITLSPEQQTRLIPGHDEYHQPAAAWNMDALAGLAGIRSTAIDMLAYVTANLHPTDLKPAVDSTASATLSAALVQSQQLQGDVAPGMRIAVGWLYETETGNYWHNGATGGHSSYAFFNPAGDYAGVVLLNTSPGAKGAFVERLGKHISQRFAGKPAISLGN